MLNEVVSKTFSVVPGPWVLHKTLLLHNAALRKIVTPETHQYLAPINKDLPHTRAASMTLVNWQLAIVVNTTVQSETAL